MRCTSCSSRVQPVVALDIDGTLGDYHGHFIKFAEDYLGMPLRKHKEYQGAEKFWEFLELRHDVYREIKLAYRQGGLKRTMPVYYGAADLAATLMTAGAEIWICTTRPFQRLDNIDPDTRNWLERNHIPYDHLIYDERKYQNLARLVDPERIVGVLEDLPEQLGWANGLGMNPLLRMNYHNRHARNHSGGLRDLSVDIMEAKTILTDRVVTWLNTHNRQEAG